MVRRRRIIIGLLELAIVVAILLYALAPRSLERATGGVYDRAAVTAVKNMSRVPRYRPLVPLESTRMRLLPLPSSDSGNSSGTVILWIPLRRMVYAQS